MKRLPLAFLSLSALPLVHVACVGDDEPGAAPTIDAGVFFDGAAPDATVTDAPGADTTPGTDAGPVEAGPSAVTVTVMRTNQAPIAGVHVVFQDAAGQVVADLVSDANGVATVPTFTSGGQVTAVMGTVEAPRLVTIVGVEPGDQLRAVDADQVLSDVLTHPFKVSSIPTPPPPNTSAYTVQMGSCETFGAGPTFGLALTRDCLGTGSVPLIATALDNTDKPVGFAYAKNVDVLALAAVDGGTQNLTIGGTWQAATTTSYSVSVVNAPSDGTGRLSYSENVGGVPTWQSTFYDAIDVDGGADASFKGHAGYPDAIQTEAAIEIGNPGPSVTYQAIATREGPQAQTAHVFDLSARLPLLTDAGLVDGGAAAPSIAWEAASPLTGTDAVVVRLDWNMPNFKTGAWTIVAPPNVTSVVPPQLPASVAAFAPAVGAKFDEPPTVVYFDLDYITTYADLRKIAAELSAPAPLLTGHIIPIVPPLPKDGTARVTAITKGTN